LKLSTLFENPNKSAGGGKVDLLRRFRAENAAAPQSEKTYDLATIYVSDIGVDEF